MRTEGIEIERKYRLRAAPRDDVLAAHGARSRRIEQVYLGLVPGTDARRVRRIVHGDGSEELVLTEKARIGSSGLARRELERTLSGEEYGALLAEADPARRAVVKTRHVVPHGAQVLEIDVFDEPAGLVVVEVELATEDEPVDLPAWLGDRTEVTGDERYDNASLARRDAVVPPWPSGDG